KPVFLCAKKFVIPSVARRSPPRRTTERQVEEPRGSCLADAAPEHFNDARPAPHICAPFADVGLCSASVEAWAFRPSYNAFMTWLQPRFGSIKARDTYQAWL